MAIKTKQELLDYWYANLIQNSQNSITGQKLNAGGVDIIDSMTFNADIVGRMLWKNEWASGEYNQYDVVRDGDWRMIANTTTSTRPAPQASGDAYYMYTGAIGSNSVVAKQVIIGP